MPVRCLALLLIFLSGACSERKYHASFHLNLVVEARHGDQLLNVDTVNAVIRTPDFWAANVAPCLHKTLPDEAAVRKSLRLEIKDSRDGNFQEATLSVGNAPDRDLPVIADAVIDGLDRYLSKLSPRGHSPHVQRP